MEKAPVERPGLFVTANIQLTIELKTFINQGSTCDSSFSAIS